MSLELHALKRLEPLTPGDFATIIRRFRALTATGSTASTLDDLIEALEGEVRLKPEHTATAPGFLQEAHDETDRVQPYQLAYATWVFDDARVGLVEEPLIEGTDRLIEAATARAGIAHPGNGFRLWFSDEPFTGRQYRLDFVRLDTERLGNWYWSADVAIEHWLCAALCCYFAEAPAALYVAIRATDTSD